MYVFIRQLYDDPLYVLDYLGILTNICQSLTDGRIIHICPRVNIYVTF